MLAKNGWKPFQIFIHFARGMAYLLEILVPDTEWYKKYINVQAMHIYWKNQ